MHRFLIGIIVGVILFAWSGVVMADHPAEIQALIDKAGGQQLTRAEKETLNSYLQVDLANYQPPGGMDTQWGPDAWGYSAIDPASGGPAYSWVQSGTAGEFWAGKIMMMIRIDR